MIDERGELAAQRRGVLRLRWARAVIGSMCRSAADGMW
jgi:hypothetical protein